MLIVFGFLFIIIFSNQYLLFNEELFIILAFFCLCYLVKSNLGGVVFNELNDRKNKILNSYLMFLEKKSKNLKLDSKILEEKINYLNNYSEIQQNFFEKFSIILENSKNQTNIGFLSNLESNFVIYFAKLVSKKRKFI